MTKLAFYFANFGVTTVEPFSIQVVQHTMLRQAEKLDIQ